MSVRSEGTLTFLFTDIEGSTRRWEADAEGMSAQLTAHDAVLIAAIERHGGTLFKHMGDGMCAVFNSAPQAVEAAIEAQRELELPVRMGLASGEAESRGNDFFGPTLNRVARVMSAGHGGQILLADSTSNLVDGVDLIDLGEHLLRDVAEPIGLFQVQADGLASEFAPLKTADIEVGNIRRGTDSFVGRVGVLKELEEVVQQSRVVTLTGFGGVGKTRLATELACGLAEKFSDGAWMVELAPVRDPALVADAIATSLGITPAAGETVLEGVANALSGRDLLLVLDNCEHVLDAAADMTERVLSTSDKVRIIATSREGLRVAGEQLYVVPGLDAGDGFGSAATQLFIDRAQAVFADFLVETEADQEAVSEICSSLDGVALAIELAAARMVSMSPTDVRDRLGDRFRLLSSSGRGLEHHQTLLGTVQWSYDLLDDDERELLDRCSVFADGFALDAAHFVCSPETDDYAVLDLLESLVRKSLVTTERLHGGVRFGLLETIRQYADERLTGNGLDEAIRERHAEYFATAVVERWMLWDGPDQLQALNWVDREFPNLRRAFRWTVAQHDIAGAATIASHTAMLSFVLQRFEPVTWAEEVLADAEAAAIPQLQRLYTAASICAITGRPGVAIDYASRAVELEDQPDVDPFDHGWASFWLAIANRYNGQVEQWLEICRGLVGEGPLANLIGLVGLMSVLPGVGRAEEAQGLEDDTTEAARARGNPFWIAFALTGVGRAHADSSRGRALEIMIESLDYSRRNRLEYFEAIVSREIAGLEEAGGDHLRALDLFEIAIESLHRAGNHGSVATTLADLAVFFKQIDQPEVAATIYGTSARQSVSMVAVMPEVLDQLRATLGEEDFEACVASGESMGFNEAMRFAKRQIKQARATLENQALST